MRRPAGLAAVVAVAAGAAAGPESVPLPGPRVYAPPPAIELLRTAEAGNPPKIAPAAPAAGDKLLPINLAAALRLADARPLVVQAAEAAVAVEAGRLDKARVLWLPDLNLGFSYLRHDGLGLAQSGIVFNNSRNEMLLGLGPRAEFAFADAIYAPLVAEQVVAARRFDVQAARNDALLDVAEAYFAVQEARGRLAGLQDAADKARSLADRIDKLGQGLAPPIEVERARTTLAEFEQQRAVARRDWRLASARLARILRLNPSAVAVPLEPPQLRVTVVPPEKPLDDLIPLGLLSRPELAAQQALVRATLAALRRENVRPLIPSLILQGNAVPGTTLAGGLYAPGLNDNLGPAGGRSDINVQLLWQFENLGFGNRARQAVARGEQFRQTVELFQTQDLVAAQVTEAYAEVEAAATRIAQAETGLASAGKSFEGNLKGLSETVRLGETLQLVTRPLEVVAALQQLQQAYTNYYAAVNGYNAAQFRLYRALGYPAQGLTCTDAAGQPVPVDTSRPAPLPPVP